MSDIVRYARARVPWGYDAYFDLTLELKVGEQLSAVTTLLSGITPTPGAIRLKRRDEVTDEYLCSVATIVAERIRKQWPSRHAVVEIGQQYTDWVAARVEVCR